MKSKRGETTMLVTLGTLVIAAILLLGMINFLSKATHKDLNNEAQVGVFSSKIDLLINNYDKQPTQSVEDSFVLSTESILLFFNKGTDPIYLTHLYKDGTESVKEDNILQNKHFLRFERPEVCTGKACVCYCNNFRPLWKRTEKAPYLEPTALFVNLEREHTGYSCSQPVCQEIDSSEAVVFGNGRGISNEYVTQVEKRIELSDEKEGFHPIMFDITLLIQNKYSDDGNFIFGKPGCGDVVGKAVYANDDYNVECQDSDFVNELVSQYKWEGGVALGGTGYARDGDDRDDKILRPPLVHMRLQTYDGYPGIIGVCNFETCLPPDALTILEAEQQKIVNQMKYLVDIQVESNNYNSYLQNEFLQELKKEQFDQTRFFAKTKKYFDELKSKGQTPKIHFEKDGDTLQVTTYANDILIHQHKVPVRYFVNEEKNYLFSPFILLDVDSKDKELDTIDATYILEYAIQNKTIQFIKK